MQNEPAGKTAGESLGRGKAFFALGCHLPVAAHAEGHRK